MGFSLKNLGLLSLRTAMAAFLSLVLVFFLPHLGPQNPIEEALARLDTETLSPTELQATRSEYREAFQLEQNLVLQFRHYLVRTVQGDLGFSLKYYPRTNADLVGESLQDTLQLLGPSLLLAWAFGSLLGIFCLHYKFGKVSFPLLFLLALTALLQGFAYPALGCALCLAQGIRVYGRASRLFSHQGDTLLTLHGVRSTRLYSRVLRQALPPRLHSLPETLSLVLLATFLVERLTNRSGLAQLFSEAISGRDLQLAQAISLFLFAIVYVLSYLLGLWLLVRSRTATVKAP